MEANSTDAHDTPVTFESPFGVLVYRLTNNEQQYREAQETFGLTTTYEELNALDRTGFTITNKGSGDFRDVCVVHIPEDYEYETKISTLVHESVHVAQAIFEVMQENSPSDEFQAYMIQEVFDNLITSLEH